MSYLKCSFVCGSINPYQSNVELSLKVHHTVPGLTSSSNRHVILKWFMLVCPKHLLASACFWSLNIRDFIKINLDHKVGIHDNNLDHRGLNFRKWLAIQCVTKCSCVVYHFLKIQSGAKVIRQVTFITLYINVLMTLNLAVGGIAIDNIKLKFDVVCLLASS